MYFSFEIWKKMFKRKILKMCKCLYHSDFNRLISLTNYTCVSIINWIFFFNLKSIFNVKLNKLNLALINHDMTVYST